MSECILTDVLEQVWKGEHELPTHPTDLLKRMAWKIAQRMHDLAVSSCDDLHAELSAKCRDDCGAVTLNTYTLQLHRCRPCPTHGWCLGRVHHLEVNNSTASAKYEYIYSCTEPYGQARHHLRLSQRGRHYEIARFAVKQHVFYYFSSSDVTVLVKECDWSLRVDPHIGHRIPTSPHHIVELVSIKSAAVTYVRYDRTLMKAIVETTFTNSMTRTWNVRTFGDVRNSSMMHRMNAPFSPSCQITPLERLLDYNERTMLDEYGDPWLRLESIDAQLVKLARQVQETSRRNVTFFPHLTALLTRQLQRRMLRVARKLLLVKAQWKEEARATDPVRKCAACAIEAVKGRLALDMVDDDAEDTVERAPKRQCA